MNKTIGIIGGGQLALMIVQAASKFGVKCICLDPNPNSPAFKYCEAIIESYDNEGALKKLAYKSDVIVYEFENIDLEALNVIDNEKLLASSDILRISKNRLVEKDFAKNNKYNTVKYMGVNNLEELNRAVDTIGFPAILKTCEMGYDGKGQVILNSKDDISKVNKLIHQDCIYEEKLDFDFEMSVICIRAKSGEIKTFNPFINEHVNNILHKTILSDDDLLNAKAINLIEDFMINNNFYGILCIEMFIKDGIIYFNEMAPRPHNSGHITLDATNVSQFEQLVRAALGYQLLETSVIRSMTMINVLGQHEKRAKELLLNNSNMHVYIYGKDMAKENRKMGHINSSDIELINKISREFKDEQ